MVSRSVDSAEELAVELKRLVDLGAKPLHWHYPGSAHFVVLADTEGNLFCVVDTSARTQLFRAS